MKFRHNDGVAVAAARAGFSAATGYRFAQDARLPSQKGDVRSRRRPDPLADIFDAEIVPMLKEAPWLRSIAIFEEMRRRHPELDAGVRRTMERRIRSWRALHGEEQEVIFRQVHEPGRMGLSDFTDMADLGVTVAGIALDHRLYHFRLLWGGFEHAHVILGGESYILGQVDFSPAVTLIGGVRVERTKYAATGLVVESIERDGDDLPQTGAAAPTTVSREYTEFFPSIHLRADLTPTVVGRLSYSRAQVRPTFGDARNFQEIDTVQVTQGGRLVTTERELDGGNPLLESLIADQFDATLAWYPTRRTALTAAAFYKNLKNPFISTTFRGDEVVLAGLEPLDPVTGAGFSEADTVGNAGSGSLLGVELGASHVFSGPLDGLFVNGNLTLIRGRVRSEFVRDNAALRLEDQASVIGNLSVGYEVDRFTARVSGSYIGDRLQSVDSDNAEFDVLRDKYLGVDVNLRFNFTPNFQIYTDVINLTNEEDVRYQRGIDGTDGQFERVANFGRTFQIGALVSF